MNQFSRCGLIFSLACCCAANVAAQEDPNAWGAWALPDYAPPAAQSAADDAGEFPSLAVLDEALLEIGPAEAAALDPVSELSVLPESLLDDLQAGVSGVTDTICGILPVACP